MAVKSIAGDHFSLITFGVAMVVIDIEPGIGLLRGSEVLHGWTHTYVGATFIAGFVLLGRPLCNWILKRWNSKLRQHGLTRFTSSEPLGWVPATTGAFVGTYSHVALDSLMHSDMRPFAPFWNSNELLSLISLHALHLGCLAAGILGLVLWFALHRRRA